MIWVLSPLLRRCLICPEYSNISALVSRGSWDPLLRRSLRALTSYGSGGFCFLVVPPSDNLFGFPVSGETSRSAACHCSACLSQPSFPASYSPPSSPNSRDRDLCWTSPTFHAEATDHPTESDYTTAVYEKFIQPYIVDQRLLPVSSALPHHPMFP